MYLLDKQKENYTWCKKWNLPYESLWGRIEKFRTVNVLEPAQLNKIIYIDSKLPSIYYSRDIAMYRYNTFKIKQYHSFLDIDADKINNLQIDELIIDRRIRYCPECIKYGYHSLFHQMLFQENCFIHTKIKLMHRCECKDTYVLQRKNTNIKPFQCEKCGQELTVLNVIDGILCQWGSNKIMNRSVFSPHSNYQKLFILDINYYFDENYRNTEKYQIDSKHRKVLQDYFHKGKTDIAPIFLMKSSKNNMMKLDEFNASQALHEYILHNFEAETVEENYSIVAQHRNIIYDKNKCNVKLLTLFFLLKDIQGEKHIDRLYRSIDILHKKHVFDKDYLNEFKEFINTYLFYRNHIKRQFYIKIFDYIYKKYVESHFRHIYNCFLYNQPEEYPSTSSKSISYKNWKYPVFLVVISEEQIMIY